MVIHEAGFESIDEEYDGARLPVAGQLPEWLEGILIRNGPGQFETDSASVDHWFDGLALLRAFEFQDREVRFSAKFLESTAYRVAQETGQLPTGGFATGGTWRRRLLALLQSEPTDNTNVNVARFGDQFVALTEAPRAISFDPKTLETTGSFSFADEQSPHLVSAHPVHDPHREETVNFGIRFGRQHRYLLHRIQDGSTTRELITTISVDRPAYVHSIGLTPNYVLLTEFPLVISLRKLLSPFTGSFIDSFEWKPDRGTRIRLIERRTGTVVADMSTAATFGFHHINAFEVDDQVVMDLVTFDGPEVIEQLYLDRLQTDVPRLDGELRRLTLAITDSNDEDLKDTTLVSGLTLPTFDRRQTTQQHRYVYGQGRPTTEKHRLVAIDVQSDNVNQFAESDVYFGEPVVVGHPAGDTGEGVVLSVGLDTARGESFLTVLETPTLTELARATLPTVLPFDFHGRFFRSQAYQDAF